MTDRREFLKNIVGVAAVTSVPSLGLPKEQTKPGVLFIDGCHIDVEDLCENLRGSVFDGWHVVCVYPHPDKSIRDLIATSHDLDDIHILEGK
jgi:putative N-acetylmannosamine-6-phosphate epimerase